MTDVATDNAANAAFRRSIEDMVRSQRSEEATELLRDLLGEFCSDTGHLPKDFLATDASSISFVGWNMLSDCIWKLDQCGEPISAMTFELEPVRIQEDDGEPVVSTRFFFDTAWPFSESTYEELLEGYNDFGSAWHNDHADVDELVVGVDGMGVMADALAALHAANTSSESPSASALRAELLGTLYAGVLFHTAIKDKANRTPFARPMAILSATHTPATILTAPVLAAVAAHGHDSATAPRMPMPMPFETNPATEPPLATSEQGERLMAIVGASRPEEADRNEPYDTPHAEAWHLPPPDIHTTGRQLRRRFVTEESIDELLESRRPGLLARLFGRH